MVGLMTMISYAPELEAQEVEVSVSSSGTVIANIPAWYFKTLNESDNLNYSVEKVNRTHAVLKFIPKKALAIDYEWDLVICNENSLEAKVKPDWCKGNTLLSKGSLSQLNSNITIEMPENETEVKFYYGSGSGISIATANNYDFNQMVSVKNSSGGTFVTYVTSGNLKVSSNFDVATSNTWTEEAVLSSGSVASPSIGILANDSLVIAAEESDGTNTQIIVLHKPVGGGWSNPLNLTSTNNHDQPVIAVDNGSRVLIVYEDVTDDDIEASFNDSGLENWTASSVDTDNPYIDHTVVAANDTFLVAYMRDNRIETETSTDGSTWGNLVLMYFPGGAGISISCHGRYTDGRFVCLISRSADDTNICDFPDQSSWSCTEVINAARTRTSNGGITIGTQRKDYAYGILINTTPNPDTLFFWNSSGDSYTSIEDLVKQDAETAPVGLKTRGSRHPNFNNMSRTVGDEECDVLEYFYTSSGSLFYENITVACVDLAEEEVLDITIPIINGTANKTLTSIFENDIINFTFNATDNINMTNGTIVINDTGVKRFFNFTHLPNSPDTTVEFSQNFTVSCVAGCVINVSGIAIDNSSNMAINDTVFEVTTSDTCSPTSPLPADHTFDCSDECSGGTLDAGGFNILITGTGSFQGTITNFGDVRVEGTDSNNICIARVDTG